jgi:hypothetical protein
MKNPVIIIKVGKTIVGETRDSRTTNDAKRKFLHAFSGYNPKYVSTQIKHK